jgi:hypothetical protein
MATFETVSVDGTKLLGGPGFPAAAAKFAHHGANGGRVDLLHVCSCKPNPVPWLERTAVCGLANSPHFFIARYR